MWGEGVPLQGPDKGAVTPQLFFLLFRSLNGEFLYIMGHILQLTCLFTTYVNIMPVCDTNSDNAKAEGEEWNTIRQGPRGPCTDWIEAENRISNKTNK